MKTKSVDCNSFKFFLAESGIETRQEESIHFQKCMKIVGPAIWAMFFKKFKPGNLEEKDNENQARCK